MRSIQEIFDVVLDTGAYDPSGDSEAIARISYILTNTPSLAVFAAEIANQKLYGARNGW